MQHKIEPIHEDEFLKFWQSNKPTAPTRNVDLIKYFKPYIDIIPKTVLGNYYWQVFSIKDPKILFVGGDVEALTPHTRNSLLNVSPSDLFQFFHPTDVNHVFAFIQKYNSKLFQTPVHKRDYIHCTIYCRVKNGIGDFAWNSLQYPAFFYNKSGEAAYGLVVYTDVSHIVKENMQPMLTIFDCSNKKMQVFTCHYSAVKSKVYEKYLTMTRREQEVFSLLILGKASKEIASLLNIAKSTVDNHRQALLKKFNASSSAELVSKINRLQT